MFTHFTLQIGDKVYPLQPVGERRKTEPSEDIILDYPVSYETFIEMFNADTMKEER